MSVEMKLVEMTPAQMKRCLPLIFALLIFGFPALAQEPPATSETEPEEVALEASEPVEAFSEVVDVHVVSVEVVVTDEDGQPVTDLRQEDFEVFEDGEPMALTNFFSVAEAAETPEIALLGVTPGTDSPLAPADLTQELQLIVFIDNLQIRPENRKKLFDELRDFLGQNEDFSSNVSVAVMNRTLHVALPFTDDLDEVYAVLDEQERETSYQALIGGERRMFMSRLQNASLRRYTPPRGAEIDLHFDDAVRVAMDMADTVRVLGERRYQMTRSSLLALGRLCETLGGLPGRKALLYLSDGLPKRPADSLAQAWVAKYDGWLAEVESDIRNFTQLRDAPFKFQEMLTMGVSATWDLDHELEALGEQASVNRVTFYPISFSGRGTSGFISAEHGGDGNVRSSTGSVLRTSTTTENFTRDSSLLQLAEDTGGVATLRSANISLLMERMGKDFNNFYSLGYSPPHGGKDNDYHRVKVKLRDGLNYEIRHSEGYRNKNWRKSLGELTLAAALYGTETNPLGVRVDRGEPTRAGKNFRVPVMVKIPFELIRMVHKDEHFNAQLTLLVLVSDEDDGGLSVTRRFDLPIKIPDARVLEAMVQVAAYPIELEMNRGRKRIAIGVHDHVGHEMSAIKYDLVLGEEKQASAGSQS